MPGILDRPIASTPIAVFDVETTGLTAGADRVVEFSVIRVEPGGSARVVLDTLVNPARRMAATEIHGITDADVADAPRFEGIAGNVVSALSGCVVAAYNVYFDMRFLEFELDRLGLASEAPHFCLMYLRPMLGLGSRCTLEDACGLHSVGYEKAHMAFSDAVAAAKLWANVYRRTLETRGVTTFRDLARLKSYKFTESFGRDPLADHSGRSPRPKERLKSRRTHPAATSAAAPTTASPAPQHSRLYSYWEALKAVLCDLEVTEDEAAYLQRKKQELGLAIEEVRGLHARAFNNAIAQCIEDKWLDDSECRALRRLHQCLSKLGWAPGE